MKTYMIIEHYKPGKEKAIYDRFAEKGRMLPVGVEFVNSWVEEKLQEWISHWNDLVDFEVIPVLSSEEAAKKSKT